MVLTLATIFAIFLGPIVALWIQRISESRRDHRYRRLVIFKELMATRATRISPRHVDALNAIEVEFSKGSKGNKRVLNTWRLYLEHLGDNEMNNNQRQRWLEKGNDLLTDLLYEMSRVLQYDFDKVALKKNVYSPQGHVDLETDQYLLRKYVVEMMAGKRPLWIGIFTGDRPLEIRSEGEKHSVPGSPLPPPQDFFGQ